MLLSKLKFVSLRLGFVSAKKVELPEMLGSTLRGAFGKAFKQAVCIMHHRECQKCMLISSCHYFRIFESLKEEYKSKGLETPPHPYVIVPPIKHIYLENEVMYFDFTLFGDTNCLPYLIYAFQIMGKNGFGKNREKFELISVKDKYTRKEAFVDGSLNMKHIIVRDLCEISSVNLKSNSKLFISFYTPIRILKDKKILKEIDLSTLKENLRRRYTNVMQLYGYFNEFDLSELELLELEVLETKYKRWNRYSNRQKKKIHQDGVYAKWILFPNSLKNYALLKAYSILHLGKSNTFGLGKFRMREIPILN